MCSEGYNPFSESTLANLSNAKQMLLKQIIICDIDSQSTIKRIRNILVLNFIIH